MAGVARGQRQSSAPRTALVMTSGRPTFGGLMSLRGRTIFITGASRGIGRAIALRAAADGAKVVIAAKTSEPHAKLEGTVHETARAVEQAGGEAMAIVLDVRHADAISAAIAAAVDRFGGIDVVVNNASAIQLTPTTATPAKRFDLMFDVNVRGTYLVSAAALPHLLRAERPHILNLSPPPSFDPKWYGPHVAYTMSKMGMSMCVLGMAEEFRGKVSVNALWPRTTIATAAVNMLGGDALMRASRTPAIMADAAHWILSQGPELTGRFFLDEEALAAAGVTDFSRYQVEPGAALAPDLFV
jgi:citronellol/citronellal dehydrogenase